MRIIVTANLAPFMPGGADNHIHGLTEALRDAGHQVELIRFPFKFSPLADIENLMQYARNLDMQAFNGISVDQVISLQFPGYGVNHPDHRVWIMHQHRACYELFNSEASPEETRFRDAVVNYDNQVLANAKKRFANSARVAERLKTYNDLDAQPLYHPPRGAERFHRRESQGYIYCPSRLETLKRQDLLLKALVKTQSDVPVIFSGDGGQREHYQNLARELGLESRVRFLGHVSEAEKILLYAQALGVFFGPFDEDYGYITLEAMLSSKPVITCTDSGGPLEFVAHRVNGMIVEPLDTAIAEALDELYEAPQFAAELGHRGYLDYASKAISWQNVVEQLTEK